MHLTTYLTILGVINSLNMKKYQYFLRFCVIMLSFIGAIYNYPVHKSNLEGKSDRDEKRYPNGTIVGKYSYTDHEGNPIQVKYYADDESYGVELKSIKVIDTSSDFNLQANTLGSLTKATESPRMIYEFMNTKYPHNNDKNKNNDPFEYLNKEVAKISHLRAAKTNPEYEVYYQNEVRSPKKCKKDKVKIYLDKEKRKIRNAHAANNYEISKYCDRF